MTKQLKQIDKDFYAGKLKKDWIAWAKKEIEEYKKFIKFLEDNR